MCILFHILWYQSNWKDILGLKNKKEIVGSWETFKYWEVCCSILNWVCLKQTKIEKGNVKESCKDYSWKIWKDNEMTNKARQSFPS